MRKFSSSMNRNSMAELNITPLMDLVFVLLIIFMITTPLMEQQIDVDLPKSRPITSQEVDPKKVRQVNVNEDGGISLDAQPVSLKELEQRLIQIKAQDADSAVSLRADANLRYQQIVQVLDAIRASGLRMALATLPEK